MSTLKAGKLQHPDAANSSIEFDASGNITKFVGPSGGADGNVLTKSGTAPAWTSAGAVGGLVLITSETFSAVSSVSVNGCFTSSYDNYQLMLRITSSANVALTARYRASGSDDSTSNYHTQIIQGFSTTAQGARAASESSFRAGRLQSVAAHAIVMWIYSPHDATQTSFLAKQHVHGDNAITSPETLDTVAFHNVSTSFDGISFIPSSGTISGVLRIYGYKD